MQKEEEKLPILQIQLNYNEDQNFNKHYDQILAGVNRIRYIKTKQKRNQIKITKHLNVIMRQIQNKKEHQYRSTINIKNQPSEVSNTFLNPIKSRQISSINKNILLSPYKSNHSSVRKLLVSISHQSTQRPKKLLFNHFTELQNKQNLGYYQNKLTDVTIENRSDLTVEQFKENLNQKQKMKGLLKKKIQTYHQMKQIRLQLEQKQRLQQQKSLHAARLRKQAVKTSCEQGRKKIQQNYFQHLEAIKLVKTQERDRKVRMTEKKYNQLLQLQKKQQQQLSIFEKSLIMEANLKDIIQLSGPPNSFLKLSANYIAPTIDYK